LVRSEVDISDINTKDLLKVLAEVKASIYFMDGLGFVNTDSIKQIYKKMKNIFSIEIMKRKESSI